MSELLEKKIGAETTVSLDIVGGKLVLEEKYDGAQVDEDLKITADVGLLIEVLEAKISNPIAKEALALVAAAVRALP
jgi:hypothetical protein